MFNYFIKTLFSGLGRQKRSVPPKQIPIDTLDQTLFKLSNSDTFTIRDSCEGIQVFGAIGSGKSSGSGAHIAKAMLKNGYSGLVLTVKPDECEEWLKYVAQTNREKDVIVINPENNFTFNFLEYEANREGRGAGMTENIVNLFMIVMEMGDRKSQGGQGKDDYWNKALRHLLRNSVDLCLIGTGGIQVKDLYRIILSAPAYRSQVDDPEWMKSSYCYSLIQTAFEKTDDPRFPDLETIADYWLKDFPGIPDRTRGIIVNSFTSLMDGFNRGILKRLFCEETSITPEAIWKEGKIIILDLPVKEYGELGLYAQTIFKYQFQRAVERRNVKTDPQPVFYWVDESQVFINSYDQEFMTTSRSARVATVFLSQNISNYYAMMGGKQSEALVDSLLGNLQTKIFHANGDIKTNEWAAKTIARDKSFTMNMGSNQTDRNRQSDNIGFSESYNYTVQPIEFTRLRKGGQINGLEVEAIIFQGGRVWSSTGKNFMKTIFNQNF